MPEYIINTASMDIDRKKEIVRCRDCKMWATELRYMGKCTGKDGKLNPNGYCAWGERRQVEQDKCGATVSDHSLCTLVKEMLAERSMLMYLINGGTQREDVAKIHQEEFTKRARKLGVDV